MSILKNERNLLELYLYICGKTQVPEEFWRWSFISLMSALMGDRVWVQKLKGKPVTPDMYIFLIGPSAVGKGTAIDKVVDLMDEGELPIDRFQGNLTSAGLKDHMGERSGIWLVSDELANDIGSGSQADAFIKFMTAIKEKKSPYDSRIRGDGKNIGGHQRIEKPLLQWLAGTTWEWLLSSITGKTATSGFGSRVLPIFASYDLNKRYPEPIYPSDADFVEGYIKSRLAVLGTVGGEFKKDTEARDMEHQWFMNRKSPEEEIIVPWWIRGHDVVLQLSMLHALMLRTDLVIKGGDVYRAIQWYEGLYKCARQLFELAIETPEFTVMKTVERYLRGKGEVKVTTLAGAMYKHQINKKMLEAAVGDIANRGLIENTKEGYRWITT